MTTVDVGELRLFAAALLGHLARTHGESVTLKGDHYWDVPPGEALNIEERPQELTIGQLSDCVSDLRSMIKDDARLNYGLVWLGDLFRAVGARATEVGSTAPRSRS